MSNDVWEGVANTAAGGAGFGAVLLTFRWAVNWLTGRHDRREALIDQKDAAVDERWANYTKTVEARCEKLEERLGRTEEAVEKCHDEKRELASRIARLEGFDQGLGDRRQEDQIAQSWDAKIKRDTGKGGRP